MKTSLENKLALGVGLAVLVLVGMGMLSYYTVNQQIKSEGWVVHTHQAIASIEAGQAILTDAENQQRGFLLTGNNQYLKSLRAAQGEIVGWTEELRSLTSDNLQQLVRIRQIESLITDRMAILNQRIELRQRAGLDAVAQDAPTVHLAEQLMARIGQALSEMRTEEEGLLVQREATVRANARRCLFIIVCGGAVACVAGLLAFFSARRDLRFRAQVQRKLGESETLMQSVLDNLPAMVFIKDLQGRYLFVNRQFVKVSDRSREVIVGKTVFDIAAKQLAQASDEHFQTILKTGDPIELEETVMYPDGRMRPHLAVKFPVRDPAGKINGVAGVSWDISERKQVENLQLQFQTLFESAPGSYVVIKPDFTIVAASNAYLETTMTERAAIMGRNFFEVFPDNPEIPEVKAGANLRESFNRVARTAAVDTMPIQRYDLRLADGTFEERYWSLVNSPILVAGGQVEYLIHRLEDVTGFMQKKQQGRLNGNTAAGEPLEKMEAEVFRSSEDVKSVNEKLRAAYQEMEAFSYSVSHDLRSPLRHIDGFIGLLKKQSYDNLDDRGRRYLDIVGGAAKQMGVLIDELLVFSRMGRAEIRRSRVDSNALVAEAVESVRQVAGEHKIDWQIAPLPAVDADPGMLRQVWVNLINNAAKYSRTRDPSKIEIGCGNGEADETVFFVRDNGVGFDMQYAHKLFGVFQRLHRAEEFEGTGIGLANVRRIVVRHGGRTWADGKIDGGAIFYFSLPKHIPTTEPRSEL